MQAPAPTADRTIPAGAAEPIATPGRPHLPGLDGLRGTAILAVVICHLSALLPPRAHDVAGILEMGWAGVDLFFVISGFLITGILTDAKGSPGYFRNFYARRFLRIFPLYYAFLTGLLIVLLLADRFTSPTSRQLWSAQPWLWTYTANAWIAAQNQWAHWAEILVPLWSLSVEEQFYLIWPIAVFALPRRALVGVCLAVMIGVLALRLTLTGLGVNWFCLYTWTLTRADALAAGGLVALLLGGPEGTKTLRNGSKYVGPVALALTLLLSRGFDPTRHPLLRDLLYTSLAVLFASILFWSTDAGALAGLPKRFYELRWLRTIGKYSYGIYILHLPLMYLSRAALERCGLYSPTSESWTAAAAAIVLTLLATSALALASFHLLEQPFLKLKRHFPATPQKV